MLVVVLGLALLVGFVYAAVLMLFQRYRIAILILSWFCFAIFHAARWSTDLWIFRVSVLISIALPWVIMGLVNRISFDSNVARILINFSIGGIVLIGTTYGVYAFDLIFNAQDYGKEGARGLAGYIIVLIPTVIAVSAATIDSICHRD